MLVLCCCNKKKYSFVRALRRVVRHFAMLFSSMNVHVYIDFLKLHEDSDSNVCKASTLEASESAQLHKFGPVVQRIVPELLEEWFTSYTNDT